MKREQMKVQPRSVLGKQVKKLRRDQGILPANVYGADMKSVSVQLPIAEFKTLFEKVGETGLVDLELDGKTLPVLIHNIQLNPRTLEALHADFFKVNLKEKITANIPVVGLGGAVAVLDKKGVLLNPMSEVEIEALPTDLPEKLEISVEALAEVGDQITVEQLKAPDGVTILSDPNAVLFKIDELVSKEAEEQAAQEEAAAEAAAAESGAEAATDAKEEGKEAESAEVAEKQEEKPAEKPQE